MPLVSILVALVILGVVLWLVNRVIPTEPWVRQVINVVAVVVVILWLLSVFAPGIAGLRVGK